MGCPGDYGITTAEAMDKSLRKQKVDPGSCFYASSP